MSNAVQKTIDAEIIVEEDGLSVLAPDVARDLTTKIRQALEFTWDLVIQAYQGRAWLALGYKTWNDYCVKEFGNQHIAIPREDRNEVVGSLRDAGLSVRAIADATGLSRGTIGNAAKKAYELSTAPDQAGAIDDSGEDSGVQKWTPADKPQKIQGVDGKLYERSVPKPKPEEIIPEPLEGQAEIDDELDTSLEDMGITPISATEVIDKNAKARVQNVKRLTGANGQYAQAPLPMV
ncbi:MAG: hypothetical protein ACTH82_05520, partial [Glutamicibacter ardleyensis]